MATRLYFQTYNVASAGTYPTAKQSARTQTVAATGSGTPKIMRLSPSPLQTFFTVATSAVTSSQNAFMGMFVSPPLNKDQTIGGGGATMILNVSDARSNTNTNYFINQICVYVWRPSTGARVGTYVFDTASPTTLGGTLSSAASSTEVTHITGITTTAITALKGDVIVCEVWATFTQAMTVSYSGSFYYGGQIVNTTENAVTTNHASYLEFSSDITFSIRKGKFFKFF